MLNWLFRMFWRNAPSFNGETAWNMEQEQDAWEGVRHELERIADALEHWRGLE